MLERYIAQPQAPAHCVNFTLSRSYVISSLLAQMRLPPFPFHASPNKAGIPLLWLKQAFGAAPWCLHAPCPGARPAWMSALFSLYCAVLFPSMMRYKGCCTHHNAKVTCLSLRWRRGSAWLGLSALPLYGEGRHLICP